jgi:hypothetical protein
MALIVTSPDRKWPGGIIPYTFAEGFPHAKAIEKAMNVWERKTALSFVEQTNEIDYVTFVESYGTACSSPVGRQGGQQFVKIVPGCDAASMIHELGHCAGLAHEQKRYDRDKHVIIFPKNIEPGYSASNWEIPKSGGFEDFGAYDLRSIMHYAQFTAARRQGQYQWSKGWTTVEFYEVLSCIYMLIIKSDGGTAHLHKIDDPGVVGKRIKTYRWSSGWTIARQYICGFQRFLVLYKKDKGTARFHILNGDGTIGRLVEKRTWSKGWTTIDFYLIGAQCFLFLLKSSTGEVHIRKMNRDGSVGERVFEENWSKGWTQALPYSAGSQRYFSILKTSDGTARFYEVKADGNLGDKIQSKNWSAGWTDVQFYQSLFLMFMLTYKRSTGLVHVHEIGGGGKYLPALQKVHVEEGWTTVRTFYSGVTPRLFLLNAKTGVVKIWSGDGNGKIYQAREVGVVIKVLPPYQLQSDLIGTYKTPSRGDIAAVNHLVSSAPSARRKKRAHRRQAQTLRR